MAQQELLQLVRPILNDYNIEMNHDSTVASCRSFDVRKILLTFPKGSNLLSVSHHLFCKEIAMQLDFFKIQGEYELFWESFFPLVQGHLECEPIELSASDGCTSVLCEQPEEEPSEAPSELDERGRAELQSQLSEMDDTWQAMAPGTRTCTTVRWH